MDKRGICSSYREGFLYKCGKNRLQGYKKRWFVLNQATMKYYPTQDTSENNVLGCIDMGRVVSITNTKNVKNGFQVITNSRTYYLSAKTSQEKDDWVSVMEKACLEAKRLSACSNSSTLPRGDSHKLEPVHEYSVISSSSGSQSYSSTSSSPYDVVSNLSSEGESSNQSENIYETFNEEKDTSPASKSWKEPIKNEKNESGSEDVFEHEVGDGGLSKLGAIMSTLSIESLDSIDSLDLSDNEYLEDSIDGETSHKEIAFEDILPKPHGSTYATEEIKKLLNIENSKVSDMDYKTIGQNYKLNLDEDTEYPAFDALKKFLEVVSVK